MERIDGRLLETGWKVGGGDDVGSDEAESLGSKPSEGQGWGGARPSKIYPRQPHQNTREGAKDVEQLISIEPSAL